MCTRSWPMAVHVLWCILSLHLLSPEHLLVVKGYPCPEDSLPTHVASLEKKLEEFISKTEVTLKDFKHANLCSMDLVLDKAVRELLITITTLLSTKFKKQNLMWCKTFEYVKKMSTSLDIKDVHLT